MGEIEDTIMLDLRNMSWNFERNLTNLVIRTFPYIDKIINLLNENGYTSKESQFAFNDYDNYAWVENKRILHIKNQNYTMRIISLNTNSIIDELKIKTKNELMDEEFETFKEFGDFIVTIEFAFNNDEYFKLCEMLNSSDKDKLAIPIDKYNYVKNLVYDIEFTFEALEKRDYT